ncbi:hypothetical protein FE783_17410 [Paenibacillus mesophilus]|uniref:glycosyl hydrolase family 28-related protein n=1 Tax=Paenibacillus mesophilus TaxID=2582849 RepID=UPI00110EE8B8|nr:glycosyl hydrolase family 28-related protein [Paenibacillus mesophilus]TMV48301.1 hypothetical protein FE783_17410 [Paenibacillus mesophilus]
MDQNDSGYISKEIEDGNAAKSLSRREMLASIGIAGTALFAGGAFLASPFSEAAVADGVYGNKKENPDMPSKLFAEHCRYATISELRNGTNPSETTVYFVSDPGQEGFFVYDSADTTTSDNTGTVIVSASGARFKRIVQGELNAKWFGAAGDSATDDTAAIQSALDTGQPVLLPAGTYKVTDTLRLKENGQMIRGAGRFRTVIQNTANAKPLLHFGDLTDSAATGYALSCTARDFSLEGNPSTVEGLALLGILDDVATWGSASRACLLEGIRITGIGSGPALRVSAWTPTVIGCEFWNSKQGIKIGNHVYAGRFIGNYISGHEAEGITCSVQAANSAALLFSGNVIQWCGSPSGMIVLSGGSAWTFLNTYIEKPNVGCGAVWALSNQCTTVTIDGVHYGTAKGEIAIDVVSTNIKLCSVRNVQVFGNVRSAVKITGILPLTSIDGVRQPSGTASVALIDDQSDRKQTFINNSPLNIEMGAAKIKCVPSYNAITAVDTATGQTHWFLKNGREYFGADTNAPSLGADGQSLAVYKGARMGPLKVDSLMLGTDNKGIFHGSGSPEGVVTAPVGSLFLRADGSPGSTLYVKESGVGNTGWAAK